MYLYTNDKELLEVIRLKIRHNYHIHYTISQLATQFLIGHSKLERSFRQAYGITIYQYHLRVRLLQSLVLLQENNLHLSKIAGMVGYKITNNFITSFRQHYNYTPHFLRCNPVLLDRVYKKALKQLGNLW